MRWFRFCPLSSFNAATQSWVFGLKGSLGTNYYPIQNSANFIISGWMVTEQLLCCQGPSAPDLTAAKWGLRQRSANPNTLKWIHPSVAGKAMNLADTFLHRRGRNAALADDGLSHAELQGRSSYTGGRMRWAEPLKTTGKTWPMSQKPLTIKIHSLKASAFRLPHYLHHSSKSCSYWIANWCHSQQQIPRCGYQTPHHFVHEKLQSLLNWSEFLLPTS